MTIEQLDAVIETADVPKEVPNIIFMGEPLFDRLQANLRLHKADSACYIRPTVKLILSAFIYRDVLIIRSPCVPTDCYMLGNVSPAELTYQKDLIGWK